MPARKRTTAATTTQLEARPVTLNLPPPGGPCPTAKPGEPRQCRTCPDLFTPGKAGGYGEQCGRCHAAERDGRTPGPRIRQPRGEPRVPVKGRVRPELKKLITPAALAGWRVRSEGELVELALARLFGREDLEPTRLSKADALAMLGES